MIRQLIHSGATIDGSVLAGNGNSIWAGAGGTGVTAGNRFSAKLCTIKGWTEDNRGVSGSIITDVLSDTTQIPSYIAGTHRYWAENYAVNETGANVMTPTEFYNYLQQLYDLMVQVKGWPSYKRLKRFGGFYVSPANWAGYGATPSADQAHYLDMNAAGNQAAIDRGVQVIDMYDYMEVNVTDAGLDNFLRHPLDTSTPGMAAFAAPKIK